MSANGFARRREQKKERIRQTARELFRTYGFAKVSVADIARKAGVSHVTIYNHFGNKEQLARDIVRDAFADLIGRLNELIDGNLPYLEKLEAIVTDKVSVAASYGGELMGFMRSPEMKQLVDDAWRETMDDMVLRLVAEGQRQGYIDPDLSPETVRYYFEIIRAGVYADSKRMAEIKTDSRMARDINHLFLYGLIRERPPEAEGR